MELISIEWQSHGVHLNLCRALSIFTLILLDVFQHFVNRFVYSDWLFLGLVLVSNRRQRSHAIFLIRFVSIAKLLLEFLLCLDFGLHSSDESLNLDCSILLWIWWIVHDLVSGKWIHVWNNHRLLLPIRHAFHQSCLLLTDFSTPRSHDVTVQVFHDVHWVRRCNFIISIAAIW